MGKWDRKRVKAIDWWRQSHGMEKLVGVSKIWKG